MKYRLFDFIQCNYCKGPFDLQVFKYHSVPCDSEILNDDNLCPSDCKNPDARIIKSSESKTHCKKCYESEITEGLLTCGCGKAYPVARGVPRFLPDAFDDQAEFTQKYYSQIKEHITNSNLSEKHNFRKLFKNTQKTFGYQWKKWGKTNRIYGYTYAEQKEWFFTRLSSKKIGESYFRGKIVLEVGCGHGRFVSILNELGSENIGLDLGPSVDLAYEINKDKPTVHIIQANGMTPPLKEDYFDYVWSHGVIVAMPSSKKGFDAIAKLPKKHTGWLYVWVYPKGGFIWEYGNRLARYITSRLPKKIVYYFSYVLVPLLYVIPAYNEKVNLSHMSWAECALSVNDWLAPRYQWHHTPEEVISWFEEQGYTDIEQTPTNGVGITGVRK